MPAVGVSPLPCVSRDDQLVGLGSCRGLPRLHIREDQPPKLVTIVATTAAIFILGGAVDYVRGHSVSVAFQA